MNFFQYNKFTFFFSGFLLGLSLIGLLIFHLNFGIDFTSGSILEIEYAGSRPAVEKIQSDLAGIDLGPVQIQPASNNGLVLRMKDISEPVHQQILSKLGSSAKELRFESIGPVIGKELQNKTLLITLLSLLVIIGYIGFAFRKITQPVKWWQWSVASFLALIHDLLIPLGIFAMLGRFFGIQFTIPVVVALLTVVGYSINNNIVVFDRVRENLLKRTGFDFQDTVQKSIQQTLTRNLNLSFATLIPLISIFFLGGEALKAFSLALMMGIMTGLYSALFFAPAFLVQWLSKAPKA